MFSHIMVGTNDIDKAKEFYNKLLGTLGFSGEPVEHVADSGHKRLFYMHGGGTFCVSQPINDEPATFANGGTIGFQCVSAEQVKAFHDAGVEAGGSTAEEPPGLRESSMGPMHLSYVRDPDGNKLCAIYRGG
jgi:catechol 2,3-dioxygenase-like lactoylglutathione lyase family enzyme